MNASVTGEQIEDLTGEVGRLREEVRLLRQVLDEVREQITWSVRNDKLSCRYPSDHNDQTQARAVCDDLIS